MIPLQYTGALLDSSGYASSGRFNVWALHHTQKVSINTKIVTFEGAKTTHGVYGDLVKELTHVDQEAPIHLVHLTPENYPKHIKKDQYNIGYAAWETDRLPEQWPALLNKMDEIWVPSEWNVEVFKNSGVTVPVFAMPHVINKPDLSQAENINIGDPETFVFYSIFQWTERKNPIGLLKAYLTEFTSDENVVLLLKSYRVDTSHKEKEMLKKDVKLAKAALRIPEHKMPTIILFGNLEPASRIAGIHKRGDCFVLPQRGEGFGIPLAEAMSLGKPTISSKYGGCLEFMNDHNSLLVSDGFITPCNGMIFGNYHGYMNWFEPSISELKQHMRLVYNDRKIAKKIGDAGQQTIMKDFSSEAIGNRMVKRLQAIRNG